MDATQKTLSDITVFNKYAKFIPEKNRRETWFELCRRNMDMHIRKYPHLETEIREVYATQVMPKKVLPSMRSMQFGGRPIELSPVRIYNCAFLPVNDIAAFSETMFLLLSGTGVGYSVQRKDIDALPMVVGPKDGKTRRWLLDDSIHGWADAVKILVKSYFLNRPRPIFDYRDIRPKGAALVTSGGKAPGPEPLRICIERIEKMLERAVGRQLKPIEVHDIQCHIADAVLSGGIRRAAMISLFDVDDEEMLTCKSNLRLENWELEVTPDGSWHGHCLYNGARHDITLSDWDYQNLTATSALPWYFFEQQRGRANNSVVLHRAHTTEEQFKAIWKKVEESQAGEPGIFWTNDYDWGTNPCFSPDTKLLTTNGYQTMEELAKKEKVTLINHLGEESEGRVWKSGHKNVVKIGFETRAFRDPIVCTPDHVFMLIDGTECKAEDLQHKRIMPFYKPYAVKNSDTFFAGFLLGDGELSNSNNPAKKGTGVTFGVNDGDVAEFLQQDMGRTYTQKARHIVEKYGLRTEVIGKRGLQTNTLDRDFISGLFSANGSVIAKTRVALKSIDIEQLTAVQEYLSTFGIYSNITTNKSHTVKFANGEYTCKESYDLNISRFTSIVKFAENFWFAQKYKQEALHETILNRSPAVKVVRPAGTSDVYDFTEPKTHWGVVEGLIAHNCCEIGLRAFQTCNLSEVNVSDVTDQEDLNRRVRAAAFLGTLQAGYTDFHYLRPIWKETTEKDALLGVSMTGIGSGAVLNLDLREAAAHVNEENARVAALLGIEPSARSTTVKPSGTTSLVLGTSSGIHAWHNDYYIRRMRVGKNEPLYHYLKENIPELIEDCKFKPHIEAVLSVPQKAPEGAIYRTEPYMDLLERVKRFNKEWVFPGHRDGANGHNVSCTISLKNDEWKGCGEWMWKNRNFYNGISVLPYAGGTYVQAPFEDITKEKFNEMLKHLANIDLSKVIETVDITDHKMEPACAGGACEIT